METDVCTDQSMRWLYKSGRWLYGYEAVHHFSAAVIQQHEAVTLKCKAVILVLGGYITNEAVKLTVFGKPVEGQPLLGPAKTYNQFWPVHNSEIFYLGFSRKFLT